ncbi:protein suppressor of hairy wing-like [Culicoides brevitarsis]|uniref:protein suppressor of hairy wing-like n=1 Tax=Culicoides brevitarsis TaxID=469753 RepID=UPI00307B60A1
MSPKKVSNIKPHAKSKSVPKSKKINDFFPVKDEKNVKPDPQIIFEEVEEIIEHICAKCEQSFDNMDTLRAHLPACRSTLLNQQFVPQTTTDTGNVEHYILDIPNAISEETAAEKDEPETTIVLDFRKNEQITVDPDYEDDYEPATKDEQKSWEAHDDEETCFCCGESVETAHTGHIRCKKCPKSFKDNPSIRRHVLTLHSTVTNKFPCDKCNAVVLSAKLFKMHLEAHKHGKQFCCRGCGKEFTRQYHLTRHLKYMNCDGKRPVIKHPCNVCGALFARMDNLKLHLQTHIEAPQQKKDFQCSYCPRAFLGSSLLNIHLRTHTGEKPFICDICKKGFPSNGALRKHRRTHTGEKPYQCTYCPSRFAAKETLNRHTKTHTGVKKYACEYCEAKFIQNSQLKAHMKAHDDSIRWECKVCGEKFETVRLKHIHYRNAHKMGKIYTCDYCKNNYITKAELKRHMQGVHLRLRAFACTQCHKHFVTKGQLAIHSNIHRIEAPVKCKLCNRMFRRRDCYRRHIRNRHKNYFEWAIKTAEKRKLGILASEDAAFEQLRQEVLRKDQSQEVVIDENKLPFDYRADIDEKGYIELVIPEEIEDEYMEEAPQDANSADKNKDLTFGGLDEHIRRMKVDESLTDEALISYTKQLLGLLLDATTLEDFGYPDLPTIQILTSIIENCGGKPFEEEDTDEPTCIRENVKLFFTLVMESDQIKNLLNNHNVDEVIQFIIKYLQSDDMETV